MVFLCFFDGFLHARDLLVSRLSATYLRDNLYTSGMHGFRPTFARACLFHSRPTPDSLATVRASTISSNWLAPLYVLSRFIPYVCSLETIFSWIFFPFLLPLSPKIDPHLRYTRDDRNDKFFGICRETCLHTWILKVGFEKRANVRKEEEKGLFILRSKCITIYIDTR